MRKVLAIIFSLIALSALLTGCMTKYVDSHTGARKYEEVVSSILISNDQKHIVFIGKEFHYVFDAPSSIVSILNSKVRKKCEVSFSQFNVNKEGLVVGGVSVSLNKSELTSEEYVEAKEVGFAGDNGMGRAWLGVRQSLVGKRYQAKELPELHGNYRLNKEYLVAFQEEQKQTDKVIKSVATPIAFVGDAVVMSGTVAGLIVLFPITIPLAVSGLHRHH